MDIDATKSRLDDTRSVTINGNQIPNIATVNAATTISAQSGQTVAFAGLIQTDSQQLVRGIPLISDLPVVGPLLSYTQDKETRTELLVIMTPHVIRNQEELDAFRYTESERMSWCLADVMEVYGGINVTSRPGAWCPCGGCGDCNICRANTSTPVIFPDTNPSGTMQPTEMNSVVEPVQIEPVPEPVPSEQEGLRLPPAPVDSSMQAAPTRVMHAAAKPAGRESGVANSSLQPAQFSAMTAGYDGSDTASNTRPWPQPNAGTWQTGQPQATARRLPPGPN
jgi:hypothetical protein